MSDSKTLNSAGMVLKRRERRGHGRLPHSLTVRLKTEETSTPLVTENVNRNGMFILTESPASPRDLVHLEIDLGAHGRLDVLAVVRHVILPDDGTPLGLSPGMGVQLYGLSASDHQRWDNYVRAISSGTGKEIGRERPRPIGKIAPAGDPQEPYDRSGIPSIRVESGADDGSSRGRDPAFGADLSETADGARPEFAVRFPNVDVLRGFQNRDLALGGFFLVTDSQLDVGTPILVRVIHPETGEAFFLDCEVLRSGAEDRSGRRGLSVRFVGLTDEVRDYFEEFVRVGATEVELDMDDFGADV